MGGDNVGAPKLCAEKVIQVPTNVNLVQPKPCVVDPIQPVEESLLDEEKVQQEIQELECTQLVKIECDESATNQSSIVHE